MASAGRDVVECFFSLATTPLHDVLVARDRCGGIFHRPSRPRSGTSEAFLEKRSECIVVASVEFGLERIETLLKFAPGGRRYEDPDRVRALAYAQASPLAKALGKLAGIPQVGDANVGVFKVEIQQSHDSLTLPLCYFIVKMPPDYRRAQD